MLASARQPRHHCAQRHIRNLRDFLVRKSFEFAQDQNLAKFQRQLCDAPGFVGPVVEFLRRTQADAGWAQGTLIEELSGGKSIVPHCLRNLWSIWLVAGRTSTYRMLRI